MFRRKLITDMIHALAKEYTQAKSIETVSKAQIDAVYDATWSVLRKIIIDHGGVNITGFGAFGQRKRAPRKARDFPRETQMETSESYTVHFTASADFKRSVNRKHKKQTNS